MHFVEGERTDVIEAGHSSVHPPPNLANRIIRNDLPIPYAPQYPWHEHNNPQDVDYNIIPFQHRSPYKSAPAGGKGGEMLPTNKDIRQRLQAPILNPSKLVPLLLSKIIKS